jgi:H+/Cl- antiporter ClcA
MLAAVFSDFGSFGMFLFLSVVLGFIGNYAGHGLELVWADVHLKPRVKPRQLPRISTIMGCLGFLIPTFMEILSAFMSTP